MQTLTDEQYMEFLERKLDEAREAEAAARNLYEASLIAGGAEGKSLEPGELEADHEKAKREAARYETAIDVFTQKMDAARAATKANQVRADAARLQESKRALLRAGQDMDAVLDTLTEKAAAWRHAAAPVEASGSNNDRTQIRYAWAALDKYIKFAVYGVNAPLGVGTLVAGILREKTFSERLPEPEQERTV